MGLIAGAVDLYMTYKFLRILTQPFDKTDAFRLGIIDENGKILKKRKELKTSNEKNAYTIFHRLIWKIKKLMGKLPFGKTRLASYAAALWFVKEEVIKKGGNGISIETSFHNYLKENNALPDYYDINENFKTFISEEILKKGTYRLKVNIPDGGVVDDKVGPDMEVGDIVIVKQDTKSIDIVLGVGIFRAIHEPSGKEIVVAAEDLFKMKTVA
jgi:hypothetical protein